MKLVMLQGNGKAYNSQEFYEILKRIPQQITWMLSTGRSSSCVVVCGLFIEMFICCVTLSCVVLNTAARLFIISEADAFVRGEFLSWLFNDAFSIETIQHRVREVSFIDRSMGL
jgi:hypothetical protein